MTEALLAIRNLRTEFRTRKGTVTALHGIDLDVLPGESLGVVGESGSGKSVTFLSVLGMLRGRARVTGEARLGGTNLIGLSEAQLRRLRGKQVALTFQDAQMALNPSLTVGEQIIEVLEAHGSPRNGRRARRSEHVEIAIDMLRRVGIPDPAARLSNFPHQFSGGMRQRAMIAMALVCQPQLLIADEPTSALDVTVQAQVLELIGEMRRSLGMSVVLIAHDLGVVAEHCDRVAVMYAGQVVEMGPTDEVIAAPRHPYTRGLIDSAPWIGDLRRPLQPMRGTVPDLADMPPGCHFAPRCPLATSACADPIPLLALDVTRQVRCIHAGVAA